MFISLFQIVAIIGRFVGCMVSGSCFPGVLISCRCPVVSVGVLFYAVRRFWGVVVCCIESGVFVACGAFVCGCGVCSFAGCGVAFLFPVSVLPGCTVIIIRMGGVNTVYCLGKYDLLWELREGRENFKAFPVLINSIIKRFIGVSFLAF